MIRKFIPLIISTILVSATSCSDQSSTGDPSGHAVVVNTALTAKANINYPTSEGDIDLSQIPSPEVGAFFIAITQGNDTTAKYHYSDMPKNLELSVGNYTMRATYGKQVACGWNTVFYDGAQDFTLSNSQSNANIKLNSTIQTAFAFARFDDQFRAVFSDISVSFITEKTSEPLVFNDGETRIASFAPADTLVVLVNVTKRDNGKKYTYGIEPLAEFKAGELHVFNFTVSNGNISFNLTTDNTVNVKSQTVVMDPNWLANRRTKMQFSFPTDERQIFVYGMTSSKKYDAVISSNIGLKHLFVSFDQQFATELGFSEVDMLNLAPQEKAIIDSKVGIKVAPSLGSFNYRLNMSGCIDKLALRNGEMTNYTMGVRYEDKTGNSGSDQVNIMMLEIKAYDFNAKKVWNRFAYVPAAYVPGATEQEEDMFPFEYWIKEGGNNWVSLGVKKDKSEVYLKDLVPATNYTTRVTFGDFVISQNAFTTLPETQIPNNDFERFWETKYGANNTPYFEIYGENDVDPWWHTNNMTTTMNKGNDNRAKSSPSVTAVDGVVNIATTGYGTSANIQHANTSRNGGNQWKVTSWGEIAPGKLFIGSENNGHSFTSYPKKISFDYKYAHKTDFWVMKLDIYSDNTLVGRTELSSNEVKTTFTETEVVIIYNNNAKNLQPTSMKLCFSSQKNAPITDNNNLNIVGNGDTPGGWKSSIIPPKNEAVWANTSKSYLEGNVLTIDNVVLHYPTDYSEYTFE